MQCDSHCDFGDYVIAIPSYDRPEHIEGKTLALLSKHGIPKSQVYIFVASEQERARYAASLEGRWPNLVVGVPTLWKQRNFITNYFPEGLHIVSLDDDVEEIYRVHIDPSKRAARAEASCKGETAAPAEASKGETAACAEASEGKKAAPAEAISRGKRARSAEATSKGKRGTPAESRSKSTRRQRDSCEEVENYVRKPLPHGYFPLLIRDAGEKMEKHDAYLWALNVSDNPFFMRQGFITKKLGLCNGFLWGCRNRHDPTLLLKYGDGHEDVERSVRFFHRDGILLRYRDFCAKTKCFFKGKGNTGGLQTSMTTEERKAAEERGNEALCQEFPGLIRLTPDTILGVSFITAASSLISVSHLTRLSIKKKINVLEGALWRTRRSKRSSSGNGNENFVGVLNGIVERITSEGVYLRSTDSDKTFAMSLDRFASELRLQRLFVTWVPRLKEARAYLGLARSGAEKDDDEEDRKEARVHLGPACSAAEDIADCKGQGKRRPAARKSAPAPVATAADEDDDEKVTPEVEAEGKKSNAAAASLVFEVQAALRNGKSHATLPPITAGASSVKSRFQVGAKKAEHIHKAAVDQLLACGLILKPGHGNSRQIAFGLDHGSSDGFQSKSPLSQDPCSSDDHSPVSSQSSASSCRSTFSKWLCSRRPSLKASEATEPVPAEDTSPENPQYASNCQSTPLKNRNLVTDSDGVHLLSTTHWWENLVNPAANSSAALDLDSSQPSLDLLPKGPAQRARKSVKGSTTESRQSSTNEVEPPCVKRERQSASKEVEPRCVKRERQSASEEMEQPCAKRVRLMEYIRRNEALGGFVKTSAIPLIDLS